MVLLILHCFNTTNLEKIIKQLTILIPKITTIKIFDQSPNPIEFWHINKGIEISESVIAHAEMIPGGQTKMIFNSEYLKDDTLYRLKITRPIDNETKKYKFGSVFFIFDEETNKLNVVASI